MAVSVVLLAACLVGICYVDRLRTSQADLLNRNVTSLQAAQELEIPPPAGRGSASTPCCGATWRAAPAATAWPGCWSATAAGAAGPGAERAGPRRDCLTPAA